jgi:hypothetical protein
MSTMTNDHALIQLASKINAAIGVVNRRGYELPAEYVAAHAAEKEAARLAIEGPPVLGAVPTKVKDVEAFIVDHADKLVRHEQVAAVAAQVRDNAKRTAYRVMQQEVTTYLAKVCDDFDEHLEEFRRLLEVAPREVSSQTTGKEYEQHAELMRAAEALTVDLTDRAQLSLLTDEIEGTGGQALWLVLDPRGETTIWAVRDALAEFSGRVPQGIDEWARINEMGCQMARGGGEAAARVARQQALIVAGANAADRGMLDKTYDEARKLPGVIINIPDADMGYVDSYDPMRETRALVAPPEVHPVAS